MNTIIDDYLGENKGIILNSLLYEDKTLEELSEIIRINKNAVKEHITFLENRGLVASYFVRAKTGRPKKYYKLTSKGMELFPKQYINFTSLLLNEIEEDLGDEKTNEILMKIANKMVNSIETDGNNFLSMDRTQKIEKLKEYVNVLNNLGYYARLEVDGDTIKIIRHNCIFYELAKNNKGLVCGTLEKSIIKDRFNDNFSLLENFPDGNNRCVVEIKL